MRRTTKLWTAGAVAALVAVPVVGVSTALADSGTPSASSTASAASAAATEGMAHVGCAKLPKHIARVEKLEARYGADASTKGSIAFLTARISAANAAGKTDLARVLGDRLAIRKDVDSQLSDILARLQDAQQVCQSVQPSSTSSS